jgi:hypothetical protein
MKLFKNTKSTSVISKQIDFPSGVAVKTESGTYWIKDSKRYKLISDRAAKSWSFMTLNATDHSVAKIKIVGKLGFRDGTLIKDISDGKMYLVSQNKKRHISTLDLFDIYGFNRSSVIEVSKQEADMHELGESI